MKIEEAIEHALDGRAILFTGAGFSYGAENIGCEKIPAGRALAKKLLTDIGYKSTEGALDKAAAAYLRRKTDADLVKLLIDQFSVGKVTGSHVTLGSLPWARVYTTNYDHVFEEASKDAKVVRNSVDGVDSPRDHLSKPNLVVHINGAISRLSVDRLGSSFKLISESYTTDSFQNSDWAFHFRNDIRTAAAVIFVGYSMYDLDVRRILFDEDISDKTVFVIAPINDENQLDAEDLADLGHVAPIGVDAFASLVETVKATYIPRSPAMLLDAWEGVSELPPVALPLRDSDVLDFMTIGDVSPALLLEACSPRAGDCVVPVEVAEQIEKSLLKADRDILLIGDVGTGKTFACNCVAQRMAVRGWHVYRIDSPHDDEIEELQQLCELDGSKLLVVENYQRHMDVLRWIADVNPPGVIVLATARSNIHELFASDFFDAMSDDCLLYETSQLSANQITSSIALFDKYGFWGSRASWSLQQKQRFLLMDCKSALPFLLLDVFKSQHVADRFSKIVEGAHNRSDIEELLICIFSLKVMQFQPRVMHVQELLGSRVQWAKIRALSELKSIIDFGSHHIHVKSVVLASYMLQHLFSGKVIARVLIGMAKEAEALRSDAAYRQIFTSLMRYSQISQVLPEANRLDVATSFYEGIKNLHAVRSDPQFWLQYAISCLAFGKLERAERYFDDAYEFAKKRAGYNTFQIDNHYAHLLLEKALIASSVVDAIQLVDQAKKLLLPQLASEVRYHPFRAALGFFKCYERLHADLSKDQTRYFKTIFMEVKRRAEGVSKKLKHRYVQECIDKSDDTLSKIGV